jgi:hypothetical protein
VALRLSVRDADLSFSDIPLEAALGRNYRVGKEEQLHRILRDRALISRLSMHNSMDLVMAAASQVGSDSVSLHTSESFATAATEEAQSEQPPNVPATVRKLVDLLHRKNASLYQSKIKAVIDK